MLVINMVEEIRQVFPNLKEAQVLKRIDYAQKKYASDINLLKKAGQLTDISSNITWTLPSDCKEVIDITFYDSNNMPLYMDDLGLSYEIVFGKITFLNSDQTLLSNLPSTITYAYLDYVYEPGDIDEVTDTLEIDEELHEGIMAYVWKNLFATFPTISSGESLMRDWSAVRYWDGEYQKYLREGKKISATNQDSIGSTVKTDTLGNPIALARQRIATTTTIPISGLTAIYSKYLRFTVVEPSTIAIAEQFGWTTTIATPTILSNVITVASSAEFTATMSPIVNLDNTAYYTANNRASTSSWTFTTTAGFGTIQVEIYER